MTMVGEPLKLVLTFLLLLIVIEGVSGWTIQSMSINPSQGQISPQTPVNFTGVLQFPLINGKRFENANTLDMFTDLADAQWSFVKVETFEGTPHETPLPHQTGSSVQMGGWILSYPDRTLEIRVKLDGIAQNVDQPQNKIIIKIQELDSYGNPITSSLYYQERQIYVQTPTPTPTTPPTPTPTPSTGSILISSSPSGTNIYIDNAYKGLTPLTVGGVPNGNRVILLRLDDYQDWSTIVTVNGNNVTVNANLIHITATTATTHTATVTTAPKIQKPTTVKTTLKKITPWITTTPTQPSPIGIETGIVAMIVLVLIAVKRR